MASEQLMVHSEETEAVVAEGLQIQPDHALTSLHVEACTLLTLHLALGNTLNLFMYTPNSTTALKERKT